MLSHVNELRTRICRIALVTAILFFVTWGYSGSLIESLVKLSEIQVITVTPFESITSQIWVTGYFTLLLALPYAFFEVYKFISVGLYANEKKLIKLGVPMVYISYIIGAVVPAYLFAKFVLSTLASYIIVDVSGAISLQSLVSFVLTMSVVTGVVFCIPAISCCLTYYRIINAQVMQRYRKHFIVFAFAFSAIVTPGPDVASMIIMVIPVIGLFEISIIISKFVERMRVKR